jgi:sugar lactone lactonase YvrE
MTLGAWRGVLAVLTLLGALAACQPLPPQTPSVRPATRPRPEATSTPDVPATISALERPNLLESYPSPDESWLAEVIRYDCVETDEGQEMAMDVLRLVRRADGQETVVDRQVQYCGGLGAFGLGGLFWSPEGRYFYYTDAREGVPDGGCGPWVRPISRVDVIGGGTETLAGAVISPDESNLAGWRDVRAGEPQLVVWAVDGGAQLSVPVTAEGAVAGPIAWSPDGSALAYLQIKEPCNPTGVTWLAHVALPGGEQTVLLESARPSFNGLTWDEAGALVLQALTGERRRLDLKTRALTLEP